MKIEEIRVFNDGYVNCRSAFYSAYDTMSKDRIYTFRTGVNQLIGEIDSEIWAVSYLLSMYCHSPKDFVLFEQAEVQMNGQAVSLKECFPFSCYMDQVYPLFSSKRSVRKLVDGGICATKGECSANDIKDLFCLNSQRFERPLPEAGNEIFRAMSAIAYSYGRQVFCFPWMSQKRFEYYHKNLSGLLEILERLGLIAIVPIGK